MAIQVRGMIALAALVALSGGIEAGSKKCSSCGVSTGFHGTVGGDAAAANWGGAGHSPLPGSGWNFTPQGTWPGFGSTNAAWGYGGNVPGPFFYGPVIPLVAPGDELVW